MIYVCTVPTQCTGYALGPAPGPPAPIPILPRSRSTVDKVGLFVSSPLFSIVYLYTWPSSTDISTPLQFHSANSLVLLILPVIKYSSPFCFYRYRASGWCFDGISRVSAL